MTDDHDQPEDFRFDETKSFSENCDLFLSCLESIDAEMAAILRDNWAALVVIVQEGERDLRARGKFNSCVATALDLLVVPAKQKGSA